MKFIKRWLPWVIFVAIIILISPILDNLVTGLEERTEAMANDAKAGRLAAQTQSQAEDAKRAAEYAAATATPYEYSRARTQINLRYELSRRSRSIAELVADTNGVKRTCVAWKISDVAETIWDKHRPNDQATNRATFSKEFTERAYRLAVSCEWPVSAAAELKAEISSLTDPQSQTSVWR